MQWRARACGIGFRKSDALSIFQCGGSPRPRRYVPEMHLKISSRRLADAERPARGEYDSGLSLGEGSLRQLSISLFTCICPPADSRQDGTIPMQNVQRRVLGPRCKRVQEAKKLGKSWAILRRLSGCKMSLLCQ